MRLYKSVFEEMLANLLVFIKSEHEKCVWELLILFLLFR